MAAIETTAASVMTGNTPRSVKAVIASARVTNIHLLYFWAWALNVWETTPKVRELPYI